MITPIELNTLLRFSRTAITHHNKTVIDVLQRIDEEEFDATRFSKENIAEIKERATLAMVYMFCNLPQEALVQIASMRSLVSPYIARELLLVTRFLSPATKDIGTLAVLPDLVLHDIREYVHTFVRA
jgi:hypothetical protein